MSLNKVKINTIKVAEFPEISYIDNPEFAFVKMDNEDRILYGLKQDGEFFFGAGCPHQVRDYVEQKLAELSLDEYEDIVAFLADYLGSDTTLKNLIDTKLDAEGLDSDALKTLHIVENSEYIEAKTDSEGKVISYIDKKGMKHELAGINTPTINGVPFEELLEKGSTTINSCISVRDYNLPKYGKVEMLKELVYTDGTNNYKPSKISKVSDKYYVSDTLVDGQVVESSIEITIHEIDIDLTQWPVDTDTKHYVIAEIDFGSYLKGTFYVEAKYQGNSSLFSPKKNFRFTFYKDILFSKKQNHKIGELISAKKYNLKAYYADSSLLKEQFGYRLIQAIRETRAYNKQYPWNENYPLFTGATGLTNGFPFRLEISGNFQGVYWFNLAKDVNNFMLDEDFMNGVLIQAETQDADFWQVLNKYHWSDILTDIDNNISDDSLPHVQAFYDFINSGYSKSQAPAHMDIDNWVDCIIILQVLNCADSLAKNMILYAGDDKTIFSPMYYDLDLTLGAYSSNPRADVFTDAGTQAQDASVWTNFMAHYWEEICDRYKELRQSVLTIEYMTALFESLCRSIEYSDYQLDIDKWHESHGTSISSLVSYLNTRLQWIDENYFIK